MYTIWLKDFGYLTVSLIVNLTIIIMAVSIPINLGQESVQTIEILHS